MKSPAMLINYYARNRVGIVALALVSGSAGTAWATTVAAPEIMSECRFQFTDVKTVGISAEHGFLANPYGPVAPGGPPPAFGSMLGIPAQSYQLELVGQGVLDTSLNSAPASTFSASLSGPIQTLQISAVGPGPFMSFTPIVDSCRQSATLALHNPAKYGLQIILRSGQAGCPARGTDGQLIANQYTGKLAQCSVVRTSAPR